MYAWLARMLVRRSLRFHEARDVEGLLKTYADDVHFSFPGKNTWAIDTRDKEDIRAWLQRFHRAGLVLDVHDILIAGPPWNTRVALVFTDHARGPDDKVVYENRGVILARGKWGKITDYTVFEDTEKVAEFDRYLAAHEPSRA